ncbi:Ig-like domain-containing protein [Thalassotalea marina]|uniref:Big-1 domain-containing protein n=1 Tax=Thalassotalea marina TaxID=1673741 RepID=A0A919BQE0_9GAMM|nr:Ig-like domain-containing protein [Thalassotalea marina]GHG02643.1 hypothetical protein GCM10017161_34440 [Thalassotalea marina]
MALVRSVFYIVCCMVLIGCGGGGGGLSDGGTTPDPTPEPIKINLSLSDSKVSNGNPLEVTAIVTQGGVPVATKLVTFTLDKSDIAIFDKGISSVATDSAGKAVVTLLAGNKADGGTIVATTDTGESSETLAFNSAGDGNVIVGPQIDEIAIFANTLQLASSGAQEIALTVIAKNNKNILIPGADISFSSDSGELLISKDDNEVPSSITNDKGQATAILSTQNNPKNRTITVTASNGSISDEINIFVVGTTVQFSGSSSLAFNDDSTYIINVLDSDSEGVYGAQVSLSLANDPATGAANLSFPSTVTTNEEGQAFIQVTGVTGGTNTIIASAMGATASKAISVQADSFVFTGFNNGDGVAVNPSNGNVTPPDVLLSDTATVTLSWNRSGTPVANGTRVDFSTTRGTLSSSSGVINNGQVSTTLTSNDAGKAIVTFTGSDGNIQLSNQLAFEFVAETVDRLIAQASPNSIGPDGQTSTISVVARDPNGNLVKNKTIVFSLSDTTGGQISPAEAITDSKGSASTVFKSSTGSAQNNITITATVKDQPSIIDTVNLTVADRELFIAIGTGNEIEDNETSYTKRFVAFVTDADSNPVKNQKLTVSSVPDAYYKGRWLPLYDGDEFIRWVTAGEIGTHTPDEHNRDTALYLTSQPPTRCLNEDINLNGILDPGEDTNNSGTLTPGNVISSLATVSVENDNTTQVEAVTDNEGKVVIELVYAQSFGGWVDINLIVSGKVGGTESIAKTTYTLPNSAQDINSEDISPPTASIGMSGPFGEHNSCNGWQ